MDEIPTGWRLANLDGCEIVVGRFRDQKLARHSHDALMLSLIDGGAQKVRYRGIDHIGAPGQIIAVPPHGVHSGEAGCKDGWRYRVLMVDTALLASCLPGGGEGFACASVISDADLVAAMEQFFAACGRGTRLDLEVSLHAVLRLFGARYAEAAPAPAGHGREARAVARARDFLLANLSQNITLDDLAAASALDPDRLIRAFTATLGLPPHAWRKLMRVREAQARLVRGDAVADVAYATGFADQPHFTRTFRSLTGVTPARYRRVHRLGDASIGAHVARPSHDRRTWQDAAPRP